MLCTVFRPINLQMRSRVCVMIRVRNARTGLLLADKVEIADTSRARRTGLLGSAILPDGRGLWLVPCEAVHTFGMRFTIDVAFLNRKRKVLKIRKEMPRRRIAFCLRAHSALELPAGTLERTRTCPGDQLEFAR